MLLLPSLALADKRFTDDRGASWDCATDPNVTIQGNNSTFTLTGACKKIVVDGNRNTVHVEAADRITINGNENNVDAAKLGSLAANGNKNTFKGKTHVADVSSPGNNNTVDHPAR